MSLVQPNVLCPSLIGRGPLVAEFRQLLDTAEAGRAVVVTVAGEAGIGKSRLVAELSAAAAGREPPFSVAHGNCFEFDTATPYALLVDLLRTCLHDKPAEEVRQCVAGDAPDLLGLVPEFASALTDVEPAPLREPEQQKRQLFAAITNVLLRFASRQPVVIILEDLHWCDDISLEFFGQFARRAAASTLVMVMTYRADEVQPALRKVLAALDRERNVTDWQLQRLDVPDVSKMLTETFYLKRPPSIEIVQQLHALTEGNPFFIEEILKSLVASGELSADDGTLSRRESAELRIPRSVQAAVHERTATLSEKAQQVIQIAAVTGQRFDFALLERLSELSEADLLDVIKELMSAQLVAEESADHFIFRHALTQQAIYNELLARERRSLHARIGEAIQSVYADTIEQHLNDLAQHFYMAEAWDETYYYCRRAGERALALHAPAAGLEQCTRAIAAAEHLGVSPPPALYRTRGQCRELLGQFGGARSDYERAFERAQAAQDGPAEWQALIDLGFLWAGRDYQRSGDYFRHAADLAELLDDDVLRAKSLNRLGNWLANVGECAEGIRNHERALAIVQQQGDEHAIADTLDLLAMANGLQGNQPESIRRYREAIALLRRLGDKERLAGSLAGIAAYFSVQLLEAAHVEVSDPTDELALGNEAVALSTEIASVPAEMFAQMSFAQLYYDRGRYCDARAKAISVTALAEETGHQQWLTSGLWELGVIDYFTFGFEAALESLRRARDLAQQLGSAWWLGNTSTYLARTLLALGRADEAEQALLAAWPDGKNPGALGPRSVWIGRAELEIARGDAEAALERVDWLIANAPGANEDSRMPALWRTRGEALAALSRYDDALSSLERARTDALAVQRPTVIWPIERSLGRAFHAMRQQDKADTHFEAAREIIDSIAEQNPDEDLRERFRVGALGTLPRPRTMTQNQQAKARFGGLTAREREVAALVARGLSNREIADELVLGERTIETHVGNILGKLDFSSRAQVAAWAVQTGLVDKV